MLFIETSTFTKLLPNYLTDEDYWKKSDHEIWMLTLYSKSERASIPGHTLKQIAEAIKNG